MQALENNLVFDTLNAIFTIERAYLCSKPYAQFNNRFIELTKLFFNVCIIRVNLMYLINYRLTYKILLNEYPGPDYCR
jgi:hypothetical protein